MIKAIQDILGSVYDMDYGHIPEVAEPQAQYLSKKEKKARIDELERLMYEAAADMRFEDAAKCRDEITALRN